MSRCRHTCWLKPWSPGIESGLEVTDRPQRLLKEFENPDAESAGLLVLLGNQSKQAAFKKLSFQTGRIRARAGGEVHLLVSSLKENRRKRIVIADTDASGSQSKSPLLSASACHAVKVYTDTKQQVSEDGLDYENLLRRTLLPSADVVCIFVDDLGGFGSCPVDRLKSPPRPLLAWNAPFFVNYTKMLAIKPALNSNQALRDSCHLQKLPKLWARCVTGICSNSLETVVYYEVSSRTRRALAVLGGGRSMASHVDISFVKIVLEHSAPKAALTRGSALSVICLEILGWNVDDCMSHLKQFAQQSFIQRSSRFTRLLHRLPLLSKVAWLFQLICTLLADSKYTAEGLEKLLIETYGQNRSITDISPATAMGAHVGVTLTRARDGSVFLATNYNSATGQAQDSDYRHLELNDGQSQSKWWQVLRCATAAPYYFKPARIGDLGVFQDGGLAVNNPVCIAIREATLLSPDMAEPSVVVSLGTGSASDDDNGSSGILSEKFLPRLSRALWKQTGSKVTWSHLLSHQRADSDTKLFRFDVDFMGEEPLLDEVSMVEHVQQMAYDTATRSPTLRRLCRHLRAELFLFELDELHPPYFLRGAYQCAGRIICQLRAHTPEYEGFIRQLCEREAAFRVGAQFLRVTYENINTDLCFKVNFAVSTLSSSISIALLEGADEESHINGSPFAIEWLIRRQALNAGFGTSDHRELAHSDLDCVP
ncbi:patatin-like phospholipase [Fusarium mundagurra]|uniref:Patatin-like phospholipase n=1 Tax=Fusarium mundagurra TaxID=1567541 RepID=A0A8H6D4L7_9HYPO|nr:patatin-like phospholipase [Fusarium mundagurra]